jgi:hypothetical protein
LISGINSWPILIKHLIIGLLPQMLSSSPCSRRLAKSRTMFKTYTKDLSRFSWNSWMVPLERLKCFAESRIKSRFVFHRLWVAKFLKWFFSTVFIHRASISAS